MIPFVRLCVQSIGHGILPCDKPPLKPPPPPKLISSCMKPLSILPLSFLPKIPHEFKYGGFQDGVKFALFCMPVSLTYASPMEKKARTHADDHVIGDDEKDLPSNVVPVDEDCVRVSLKKTVSDFNTQHIVCTQNLMENSVIDAEDLIMQDVGKIFASRFGDSGVQRGLVIAATADTKQEPMALNPNFFIPIRFSF